MAASFMKKTMAYLGLVDDEYDDDYDDLRGPATIQRVPPRSAVEDAELAATSSRIRPITREEIGGAVAPVRAPVAPAGLSARPAAVRALTPETTAARVHVIVPMRFGDAQEIGSRLKENLPVIVNLQNVDHDLARRMVDFCSGVAYGAGGSMERVADKVFLLTPTNVKVSDEERQRLQERGLVNP